MLMRTVKLDDEATRLLKSARAKWINENPSEDKIFYYKVIKCALKKYVGEE